MDCFLKGTPEDEARGYRIGQWKEYKNYECLRCQHSTLYLALAEAHQADNQHDWAFPGQNPEEDPLDVGSEEPEY